MAKLKLYLPDPSYSVTLLENGRVKCDICDKDFSELKNARQHFKTIHTKANFQCEMCDKNFSALRYKKDHIRLIHGISAKMTSKLKATKQSVKKQKEPSKKVIADEPKRMDVKEEPIED